MIRKSIEKERQPEADFMRTLCAPVKPLRELSALSWSMPDVYRVVETKGSFDIYMEFIQGIGFRPLVERASLERSLARAIYDLQFILPALCRCHGVELKERGNPGSAFRSKIAPHVSPDLWKKLKGIIKLQKSLPVLASHNDIFWPNLGVREDGDEQAIAFIDFGLIGLNVAGAELHHFARAAFRSGKEARFFRSLSKHYATTARFDQDLIELNAFFYSAQRLIAHEGETRFPASRGLSEDARRLLEAAAERYDTARMKLRRAVSG